MAAQFSAAIWTRVLFVPNHWLWIWLRLATGPLRRITFTLRTWPRHVTITAPGVVPSHQAVPSPSKTATCAGTHTHVLSDTHPIVTCNQVNIIQTGMSFTALKLLYFRHFFPPFNVPKWTLNLVKEVACNGWRYRLICGSRNGGVLHHCQPTSATFHRHCSNGERLFTFLAGHQSIVAPT